MRSFALLMIFLGTAGGGWASPPAGSAVHIPWREAGLTESEAAAHLLSRFAYGHRPGEVEKVVKMGLDRWLERQLAGDLPDDALDARLRALPALRMSTAEMARTYPPVGLVLAEARQVDVTPKRFSSGCAQWVPARTATPWRSMTMETSWAWMPCISKATMAPLPGASPKILSELIRPSR